MPRLIILFLFVLLSSTAISASPTVFIGKAMEYSGSSLIVYTYEDYLIFTEKELARTVPDKEGNFTLSFSLNETALVFFHLGKNMVYIYAEPGVTYNVILPPHTSLSQGDLLNPYFREDEVMLGISNSDSSSLNACISRFDEVYGPVFAQFALNVYDRSNSRIIDSVAQSISNEFAWVQHPFFKEYEKYKLGMLKNIVWQFKARSVADKYFYQAPVQFLNAAYMELFNKFFDDYFQHFSKTEYGNLIYDVLLNQKSYRTLNQLLCKDSVLENDTLRGLVILKNLHDEFYKGSIPRTTLLEVLDSMIRINPVVEQRELGVRIREKVIRLLPGFDPPPFTLYDRNGNLVKLSDFKGKYVYLCFCNCFSYSCMKEFEMLKNLYSKHKDHFTIITVSADSELQKMQDFLSKNDYEWIFLNYLNQTSILKDYDIRAFPTYFVIGPDGKLLLSPAPGPAENFESYMFQLMRSRGDL